METFTKTKELVPGSNFNEQRNIALKNIDYNEIDIPIIGLIKNILKLDYCFTLQSCYGHFLYQGENNQYNIKPLPIINKNISINYRIAYIAICIRDNREGKTFLKNLTSLTLINPEYVQLGSAEWFWQRQINSFVLQVEPERFIDKDRVTVDYKEALSIEKVRNQFFIKLNEIIEKLIK